MAYMIETQTAGFTQRLLNTLAQFFQDAAKQHAKRRIYIRTLDELRALSDRELSDIGMHRSMLRQVARDAAETTLAR